MPKARWTSQIIPKVKIAADSAGMAIRRYLWAPSIDASKYSTGSAISTIVSWASSTPTLKHKSGGTTPDGGRSTASVAAEPTAGARPKPNVSAKRQRTSGRTTFSAAVYAIDAAIKLSTSRDGSDNQ